jgi:membrane-associated phospholipid phosphatase
MSEIARSRPAFYAHEFFFGGYLLITFLRLVLTQGMFGMDALIYGIGLVCAWALRWYDQQANTAASLRWRLLFYPVAMCVYFQQMRTAIPAIAPEKYDAVLRSVDSALIGDTPSVLWQNLASPSLTELMSFCYLLFFPYLLLGVTVHFIGPVWRCTSFVAGLFSLYGIGFLGYTLVPAAGPYLAFSDAFNTPLSAGPLAAWNAALVHMGSTGVDVFPSLHVAVSLFILGFDFQHNKRRFWIFLVPCMGLCCSTLYLRYHYLADVLCGVLLAGCALWIANRYNSSKENTAWN